MRRKGEALFQASIPHCLSASKRQSKRIAQVAAARVPMSIGRLVIFRKTASSFPPMPWPRWRCEHRRGG